MTVDDLTPAQRIEVQEFWLAGYLKRRNFRISGQPERRGVRSTFQNQERTPWAQHRRWWLNDSQCRLERQLKGV